MATRPPAPPTSPAPPTEPVITSLPPQEPQGPRPPVREPAEDRPPVTGPSLVCQNCGDVNPASRTYCQRCGERLPTEPAPAAQPPGYVPEPYRPQRQFNGKVLLVVLLAAALILIGVIFALGRGGSKGPPTTQGSAGTTTTTSPTSAVTTATPPAEPTKVDPAGIQAQASSELPSQGALSYGIANTLDGNLRTAWNSNGAEVGTGVGQVLSYRFPARVHLRRIDLVNGYAKSDKLFRQNGRIGAVAITTDAGTSEMPLNDSIDQQSLEQDFGVTNAVSLRVLSVYPGSRYPDLGLTEISFWATPAD